LPWSTEATTGKDCTFQQLAPYIGRIKTEIARYLISTYSAPGDLIVDPFAGSGVLPFEAALLGRRCLAADISQYAYLLMRAKFAAPENAAEAIEAFTVAWTASQRRRFGQDLRSIPKWVRAFFHPETLRNALALRDELVAGRHDFLLACLLGILHHQRPGFLSYPSSHLVPYLRDRLFPRSEFPEMYRPRDIPSRMTAKIERTYRRSPQNLAGSTVVLSDSRHLDLPVDLDAVITSPPYMNELDYVRDNRLRLWFLLRGLPPQGDIRKRDRERQFRQLISDTFGRLARRLRTNGHIVLVVGDSRRGRSRTDAASIVASAFEGPEFRALRLVAIYRDSIPDIRRARRDLAGTKAETVLVYAKTPTSNDNVRHG